MASKTKKLALVADIFDQNLEGTTRKIPLNEITPSTDQPRQEKDVNIEALSRSLQEEGLLQPIVVTKENNRYVIIAGERRYRAATLAGWKEIECRILNKNAKDKFRLAVIENLQRENLDAVEEARSFRRLKDEFNYTDADLAEIVGKSRNYVSEILSITEIPAAVTRTAREAGINSRNLLVQLAQASKANKAEEFIEAYKAGAITTVKTAKTFNQAAKTPPQTRPASQAVLDCAISINPDKSLQITIKATNLTSVPDEKILRNKILSSVASMLSK